MASTPPQRSTTEATTAPSCSASASSPRSPSSLSLDPTQVQRQRERLSRKKRLDKAKQMRKQIEALERTALALRVAPDADTIWDEFLDDDTKRVRGDLRRIMPVADEIKRLTHENTELQWRLTQHELRRQIVEGLLSEMDATADWQTCAYGWRALAKFCFQPLTKDAANAMKDAALEEMDKFIWSEDTQSTGMSMLGWRDRRRLLPSESSLQFSLSKIYRGYDLNHHVHMMWRVYSEQELYSKVVMGGRGLALIHIVQQLSATMWVVRIDERYDDMAVTIHELYLLFRVESDDGAIHYLYSFEDVALQNAMNTPSDLWTSNYYWMKWDVLDKTRDWSSTDYCVSVGGCLRGADAAFLHHWLFEIFAVLVRSEGVVTDRPLLDFS